MNHGHEKKQKCVHKRKIKKERKIKNYGDKQLIKISDICISIPKIVWCNMTKHTKWQRVENDQRLIIIN